MFYLQQTMVVKIPWKKNFTSIVNKTRSKMSVLLDPMHHMEWNKELFISQIIFNSIKTEKRVLYFVKSNVLLVFNINIIFLCKFLTFYDLPLKIIKKQKLTNHTKIKYNIRIFWNLPFINDLYRHIYLKRLENTQLFTKVKD